MGGLMVRFFPLAVEDLSCPDLTELPRSPRARLRPPTEAAESIKKMNIFLSKIATNHRSKHTFYNRTKVISHHTGNFSVTLCLPFKGQLILKANLKNLI